MKRVLAIVIAALMMLMCVAVAEGSTERASEAGTFTIVKRYTSNGGSVGAVPEETLKFNYVASADPANPDDSTITINEVTVDQTIEQITINYPAFTKAGVYRYSITEVEGDTQGVTYDDGTVNIAILVSFDENGQLVAEPSVEEIDGAKKGDFENEYDLGGNTPEPSQTPGTDPTPTPGPDDTPTPTDPVAGNDSLKVTKKVSGNLADPEKYFTVKVTLTAKGNVQSVIQISGSTYEGDPTSIAKGWKGDKEVTLHLKDGETIHFNKIPDGVTYAVEEDASHLAAGTTPTDAELNSEEGYLATYENETGTVKKGTNPEAVITNTKGTEVKTGINMTTLPYFLILALVAAGAILMIVRRRNAAQD